MQRNDLFSIGDRIFTRTTERRRTFVVGSLKEKDGLPKGDYSVYFSGAVVPDGADSTGMPKAKSLIDIKYTSPESTPLKISVTGKDKLDLKVDRSEKDEYVTAKIQEAK